MPPKEKPKSDKFYAKKIGLAVEQVIRAHQKFDQYDEDKNGVLDVQESTKLLSEVFGKKMNQQNIAKFVAAQFKTYDTDNNGSIDFEEFLCMYRDAGLSSADKNELLPVGDEEIAEGFKYFDEDKDGKLNIAQAVNCVRALGRNPTDEQAKLAFKDAGDAVDEKAFAEVFKHKYMSSGLEQEKDMMQAFATLDRNRSGKFPADDLRWLLKWGGMEPDEIETVLKELATGPTVDWRKFVDTMINGFLPNDRPKPGATKS